MLENQVLTNYAKFSPPSQVKVGIDIDGVCADFSKPFTKYLGEKFGRTISHEEIYDYSWWKCFAGMTEDVFWHYFHEFGKEGHYRHFPLHKDAKQNLPYILNKFDYHFITSRPDYVYDDTIAWLHKHFGPIRDDKITFCRGAEKSKSAIEHGIDIFIEDAPHHAEDIMRNTDIPLYLMDAPYNKDIQYDNGKMTRVYSWEDIVGDSFTWKKLS